ncbi:enoyl-CoA hydratase-related protein [Streptomyces murinus]|uniref:enoyl-CoA hydratase-related protein n=1 Tax=Streptomyces murinus TaxID=33900 RepID=UPI002E118006|nr:enoyl-CoA hydratase-related protein [Streptomyces murinus]WSI88250.1 enoyl-CoA hydratase-related protein [Streptomyces murinus]
MTRTSGSAPRPGRATARSRSARILGSGFELAPACDIVVVAEHAVFALPKVERCLVAGVGGMFRTASRLPFNAAIDHLLTHREFSAQRGYELGLASEVVPA